jgi:ketosteroid isomerase-like protein
MSRENVELVREAIAEFLTTGELSDEFSDDAVWDMTTYQGWPEQGEYHGRDGFREFLATWRSAFEDWRIRFERIEERSGGHVLAVFRQSGRPRGGTASAEMSFGVIYEVEGGKIRRMRAYATVEEALLAAPPDPSPVRHHKT